MNLPCGDDDDGADVGEDIVGCSDAADEGGGSGDGRDYKTSKACLDPIEQD